MQRGIQKITRAVRPTLGPLPKLVAIEKTGRSGKPEILDCGGIIARRIIQIKGRDQDMGAMFLRQMLWRQYEKVGDGTATACVIFESMFSQGIRLITAGANAQRLRFYMEQALALALQYLKDSALPIEGQQAITHLAESLCYDHELAVMLGEVIDMVGEYGDIDIRMGRGRELEREYIEGTFYKGGLLSKTMADGLPNQRMELEDAAVFASDLEFKEPEDIVPILDTVYRAGIPGIIIIAGNISDKVMSILLTANRKMGHFKVLAVKAPDSLTEQSAMLKDISVLTGARLFLKGAGESAASLRLEDLGRARRVWGNKEYVGIVRGKGSPRAVREYIASLRAAIDHTDDADARRKLRERVARLMGGSAVLWVGAVSEMLMETRKEMAERTVTSLRSAVLTGVLPGGGAALLAAARVVEQNVPKSEEMEARAAFHMLAEALREPTRAIIQNAGYDPANYMQAIHKAGSAYAFDVRQGKVVNMLEAGVLDSAGVLNAAVFEASASAALALTVDVLIHKKKPQLSFNP